MATYDERSRATAARLLSLKTQNGYAQIVTLSKKTSGIYNPATSQVDGGSTITQTTSGVVLEYDSVGRRGLQRQDKSLIQSGDRQLILSPFATDGTPLNPAPGLDDSVTLSTGQSFTITTVAVLAPGGIPIMYECNIRGVS